MPEEGLLGDDAAPGGIMAQLGPHSVPPANGLLCPVHSGSLQSTVIGQWEPLVGGPRRALGWILPACSLQLERRWALVVSTLCRWWCMDSDH
jgi:hypothetical protein